MAAFTFKPIEDKPIEFNTLPSKANIFQLYPNLVVIVLQLSIHLILSIAIYSIQTISGELVQTGKVRKNSLKC